MYYRLHDHCKLVSGAARGAIYDLAGGKVYSVNQQAINILRDSTTMGAAQVELITNHRHFFDLLTGKGLGGLYFDKPPRLTSNVFATPTDQLDFVWLELTDRCNQRCPHCYMDSASDGGSTRLALADWLETLDQIHAAGCGAVQLIGGEPLLYAGWREIVEAADRLGFEFCEVFTNATLIDDSCIDFFRRHRVCIATTIFAATPAVHDAITGLPGSFSRTLEAIRKLQAARVPLRIASVVMQQNEREISAVEKLCRSLNVEPPTPDTVRPAGRGANANLLPVAYKRPVCRPPFLTNAVDFHMAHFCHPCLSGKLAITSGGDVLPCIFARHRLHGNLKQESLNSILQKQCVKEIWHLTKDKITKCQNCEYRYACPDCRFSRADDHSDAALILPPENCAYDPYSGVWK